MNDLAACAIAADMLQGVGFVRQYVSMKSEATYWQFPGKEGVIRIAAHKAGSKELNGVQIISKITIHERNFTIDENGDSVIPRDYLVMVVARAIGHYFLRNADVIPLPEKLRRYRPIKPEVAPSDRGAGAWETT